MSRIVTVTVRSNNANERVRQALEASVYTDSCGNPVPISTTSKHVSFEVPNDFVFSE